MKKNLTFLTVVFTIFIYTNVTFANDNNAEKNYAHPIDYSDPKDFSKSINHGNPNDYSIDENIFISQSESIYFDHSDDMIAGKTKEDLVARYKDRFILFPNHVNNINLNVDYSSYNSLVNGATIQKIEVNPSIDRVLLDTKALTYNLNNFIESISPYFIKNKEYIGTLKITFIVYSSYGKMHFDYGAGYDKGISYSDLALLAKRNEYIVSLQKCNEENFCSAFVLDGIQYIPYFSMELGINTPGLDIEKFEEFLILNNHNMKSEPVFLYDYKPNKEPIYIDVYIGTNGYHINFPIN